MLSPLLFSLLSSPLLSPLALAQEAPPTPWTRGIPGPIIIDSPDDLAVLAGPVPVEIIGDLIITGPDLTELAGMEAVVRVQGDLRIHGCEGLENLEGLSSLLEVDGTLDIRDNPALTSLEGLTYLERAGGGLWMVRNPMLTDMDGLERLRSLGAPGLFLDENTALASVTGLRQVSEFEGNIFVAHSDALTSLDGLQSIRDVSGDLLVAGLPALQDLRGLSQVSSVEGFVFLAELDSLSNLAGLEQLGAVGDFLFIGHNDFLADLKGLDGLSRVSGDVDIHTNPVLKHIVGLNALTYVGGDLRLVLNPALQDLRGMSSLVLVGGYLLIYGNPALSSLEGLERLHRAGDVYIPLTDQLTSHAGLEALLRKDAGIAADARTSVLEFDHYASPQLREGQHPELTVTVSSSGGGLRTGNFLLGIFSYMDRIRIEALSGGRVSALDEVDYLSTVSGGSMATGGYLARRDATDAVFQDTDEWMKTYRTNYENSVIFSAPKLNDGPPVNRFEAQLADKMAQGSDGVLTLGDVFVPLSDLSDGRRPTLPMWAANTTEFNISNGFPFTPGVLLESQVCWYNHDKRYYYRDASQQSLREFVEAIPISVGMAASSTVPPVATLGVMGTRCSGIIQDAGRRPGSSRSFSVIEEQLKPHQEHLELADGAYSDRFGLLTAVRMTWEDTNQRQRCAGDGDKPGCDGLSELALPDWSTLFVVYSHPDFAQLWQPGPEAHSANRSLERAFDVLRKDLDTERLDAYLGAPTDTADPNSRRLVNVTTGALPIVAINLGMELLVDPHVWEQFENPEVCRAEMASLYEQVSRVPTRLQLSEPDQELVYRSGQMVAFLQQSNIRLSTWLSLDGSEVDDAVTRRDASTLAGPHLWLTPPPDAYVDSCGDLVTRGTDTNYQTSWVYDPRLLYGQR